MSLEPAEVLAALELHVGGACNRLRKEPLEALEALVVAPRLWTRTFRSLVVCLAATALRLPDRPLAVIVRGYVPPADFTRTELYGDFWKRADGSWRHLDDEAIRTSLREQLSRLAPML